MNEVALLAKLLFSEAYKRNIEGAVKDATAIAHVVKNRMAKRNQTLEQTIYEPFQFSGVGSSEWQKIENQKLTQQEENIYKKFLQVSYGVLKGDISDPTGGANYFFNPKLANPSWAKKMKKSYKTEGHNYYIE